MTEYYRVRTPEQWDWLVNRFGQSETQWPEQGMSFGEIHECLASGGFVIVHNDYFPSVGSVLYTAVPQNNGNVIEVSDLMEGEKMKDYVEIKGEDLKNVEMFCGNESKGNLREFWDVNKVNIPKSLLYPKVKMTETEKKEFDELKRHRGTVYGALDMIEDDYHKLYTRLFGNSSHEGDSKAQLEFARAWVDPSLIEVIPEKRWNVKIPPFERTNKYYYKSGTELDWACSNYNDQEDQQFTESELKEYGLDDDMYEKVEVKK